jgi:putative ABC transport system permease protein
MSFVQIILEAFRSLGANLLRTALTMLGIIIGIASVVVMLAVGDAVKAFINKELQVLGSGLMIINSGNTRGPGNRSRSGSAPTVTLDDADALNSIKSLSGAAPALTGYFQLTYANENSNNSVVGIDERMFPVRNWKVAEGSGITDADVRAANRVIVIGKRIAEQFFYRVDPIGKQIRIDNVPFIVVGVLASEGRSLEGGDVADMAFVPITAARANLIRSPFPRTVHYVIAQAKDDKKMKEAEADIKDLMRDRHRIRADMEDDFRVENLAAYAEAGNAIGAGLSIGFGVVGAISLLVGGIGIMNIMLVSVTERTREIGIRMAIGAKPRDVLLQFLMEAVVICLVGGAIGILLSILAAWGINATGKLEVPITMSTIAIATAFATIVGIFFGFYPATRAAGLQPVECLRYD